MIKNFRKIFRSESLKRKILWTLGLVLVFQFLSVIPVPGVDVGALEALKRQMEAQSSSGLAFFSALMGGGLSHFSIILMGLSPYINASIILQLLTVVIPKLEALKKEGEQGQRKINQYTRLLTLPLALAQSYGMILLLNTLIGGQGTAPLIDTSNFLGAVLPAMIFVTGGTILLMWLGEIVNEVGIGNGISLIIFAGVLSAVPGSVAQYSGQMPVLLGLFALTLGVIWVIVRFTEGYRKIPLIYTRTGRDERSYFPIRVNQAGMVPIIFAISLVTFPSIIGQILMTRGAGISAQVGQFLTDWFNPQAGGWLFIALYFLFVLGFTFFYVSITFNATDVAESIQRRGGYIPGIRPGADTAQHLADVSAHLNVWGGGFLALIAVFPYLATKLNLVLKEQGFYSLPVNHVDFVVSGAGLIIAVGTVLELMRRVDVELKSYDYKKFR